MKNRHIGALWLLTFLVYSIYIRCSIDVAGGGADVGNPVVMGTLITSSSDPASHTEVILIPEDYNPVEDVSVINLQIDTTDSAGNFFFEVEDTGVYNILAKHLIQKTRLVHLTIPVFKDTATVYDMLTEPGAVEMIFSDTVDTSNRYLYIPGTTVYSLLFSAVLKDNNVYRLTLDSLAEGIIPEIRYAYLNNPQTEKVFTDSTRVISNETVVVVAFPSWDVYTTQNSDLPVDSIYSVFIEPDGTGWFGTYRGGVVSYDGNTWTPYNTGNSDIPSNVVLSMAMTGNNIMWYGTAQGVAAFDDGANWQIYDTDNSDLPDNRCFNITVEAGSTLWFSTWGGVAIFNTVTWTIYDTANSELPDNRVYSIAFDRQGAVWIGMYGGGMSRLEGGDWTHYNAANSDLPDDSVYCVAIDKKDDVWVGTGNGLAAFDGSTWTIYTTSNSLLPDNTIWSLAVDSSNTVWVGTTEGTVKIHNGDLAIYTTANSGFPSNQAFAITADNVGNTWFGTGRGVVRFGLAD